MYLALSMESRFSLFISSNSPREILSLAESAARFARTQIKERKANAANKQAGRMFISRLSGSSNPTALFQYMPR
jgi:hypothetical protein